jgi:outer membrane protein assembly factor BamA
LRNVLPLLLIFVTICIAQTEECFIQIDSSTVTPGRKKIDGMSFRKLRTELKGVPAKGIQFQLAHIGDSLGYFNHRFDTLPDKRVVYLPGVRAIIKNESISGIDSTVISSISVQRYPCKYDASEIKNRAEQITEACAEHGFPFSKVTIDLTKVNDSTTAPKDTFLLQLKVFPDERCVNADPVLEGIKYCSPRLLYNDITIHSGEWYDLQKQQNSVLRLKARSYIVDVKVDEPQLERKQYTPDNPASVVVPFHIVDRSGLGIDGAAGVVKGADEKPEISGSLQFSLLNVFHTGESAELGYTGDKKQQLLHFNLSKPWLLNLPIELAVGGGLEVIKQEYGYIYGNVKMLTEIGAQWHVGLDLKGNESTVSADSVGVSGHFYGAGFVIKRQSGRMQQGDFAHTLYLEVGSGISRKEKVYNRTSLQFNAGIHVPVLSNQAIVTNVYWFHVMTKEDKLLPSEMYRIGGNTTLRGYADNEHALRTAFHGQLQYMLYLSKIGAVYLFSDGGVGFKNPPGPGSDYLLLAGYGLGIKVPSRIGTVTLEWARNIDDTRSPGRIHLRYSGGTQ